MISRRSYLASLSPAVGLLAGCTTQGLSIRSESCSNNYEHAEEITANRDPVEKWKLGKRIPDPNPEYKPRFVTLVNTGPERTFDIVVQRDDSVEPVLSTTVELADEEFARIILQEPDAWIIGLTLPDGTTVREAISTFDCNTVVHYFWVQCDGNVKESGSATLIGCEDYPINESG